MVYVKKPKSQKWGVFFSFNFNPPETAIKVDPLLFWQMPSNVLTTGLEEEEALNACDPYFWQAIHIFGKAPRVTKNGLQGPQK